MSSLRETTVQNAYVPHVDIPSNGAGRRTHDHP